MDAESSRGREIASFEPWGVQAGPYLEGRGASFPFPRSFAIYETGLSFFAYGTYTWAPKAQIYLLRRGPLGFTVKWNDYGQEYVGSITSLGHERDAIAAALSGAGYVVQHR